MNYLKKIYKPLIYTFSIIIISTLIITALSYFNIINYKISIYLEIITGVIVFLIGGIKIGKLSNKKGYIEGLKFGLIILILMFIISLIFNLFKYKSLIYYLLLLISSIIGSMLGINKKE